MRELIRKITATGLIILLFAVVIKAQTDYSSLKEQFRKEIKKKMRKHKVRGVSIALVESDNMIWAEGFGYADAENKIMTSPETQYKIASITKLFTGISVMQLNERKLLNIDEPVNKFLPEFKIKSRFGPIEEITPRNVMSHTAGIPCDIAKGSRSENPESYLKVMDYLNKEYTIFKPNEVYAYSNAGFSLLGCLVEKVSKTPYPDYVKKNILEPIGMKNTGFDEKDVLNLSKGYNEKGKFDTELAERDMPAGDMISTVNDLSKFISYLLKNKDNQNVLFEESLNEMTKVQFDNCLYWDIQKVGLVWELSGNEKFGTLYGHSGDLFLAHSNLVFSRQHNLGVVILTNSSGGAEIAPLCGNIIKEAIRLKNNWKKTDNKKDFAFEKTSLSEEELSKWTGHYAGPDINAFYEIKTNKNKLMAKVLGIKMDLIPISTNQFVPVGKLTKLLAIKLKSLRIEFIQNKNGTLVLFKDLKENTTTIVGQRFNKSKITDKWKKRTGQYTVVNYNQGDYKAKSVELVDENDILVLKIDDWINALEISSDDLAYVLGTGRNGGYSVAVEYDENRTELLRFSGHLLKRKKRIRINTYK